jgi:hypothetical protein
VPSARFVEKHPHGIRDHSRGRGGGKELRLARLMSMRAGSKGARW